MHRKTKFNVFWISIVATAFLSLAYLIVPPLLNFNRFRADIANALTSELGESVEILGNVKLSMLGYPMLSLENVKSEKMAIKSMRFRIPWANVFNLSGAKIKSGIKIYGANIKADKLSIPNFNRKIMILDSRIVYDGKDYEILSGVVDDGSLSARVRIDQHKYNVQISRGDFLVTNPNEDLKIVGKFAINDTGEISASGNFTVNTNNFNEFFALPYPRILEKVKMSMDFKWDGKGGFEFSEIKGNAGKANFNGQLKLLYEDGKLANKSVKMRIDNADLDLSFLTKNLSFFNKSDFDVSIYGNIKTAIKEIENIKHISMKSVSKDDSAIDIELLKIDDDKFSVSASGKVIGDRADNLDFAFYHKNSQVSLRCILSGNSKAWGCSRWVLASENKNATGTLSVTERDLKMQFNSENMELGFPDMSILKDYAGTRNIFVQFQTAKKSGTAEIKDGHSRIEYVEKDAEVSKMSLFYIPLPTSMIKTIGNISVIAIDNSESSVFQSLDRSLEIEFDYDSGFVINHKDARKLLSNMIGRTQLPFLQKDIPIIISGKLSESLIPDLKIKINGMLLEGVYNNGSISLKGALLDFDKILDDKWFAEFIDNQYLNGEPMLAPFDFGANVAITADKIKMNGATYDGFVYSLSGDSQKMSISDSKNGDLLLSIAKDKSNYNYLVQLNKFYVQGKIFGANSLVNLSGTVITAQAELATFGMTAYDIRRNMTGIVDASFDGGVLTGLGTDQFYANVNRYGKMDTENALHLALGGGETNIKEMQITGEYNGGDFRTTKPFMLSAKYTDITGNFEIKNDSARVRANIVLRGTSAIPKPIALTIDEGKRNYSLSEILPNIDLEYMRQFIGAHKRF